MIDFLSPFGTLLAGVVFALILNIPMTFLEKHLWKKTAAQSKLRRPICILLSFLLIFGLFCSAAFWIIPSIISAVSVIRFPKTMLKTFFETDAVIEILSRLVKNTALTCIRLVIAVVFSIYILANKEKLLSHLLRLIRTWLPPKTGDQLLHIISVTTGTFRLFIAGQTLEALILGSLCSVGMILLRLPYALMTGTLVGITALFPVIGAYAGAAAGAALIYTKSSFQVLLFLLFLFILQQLENNFIYPKIVGSKIKLPPIWVLASITVGGSIAGPVGMFLAVPSTASVYTLLKEATEKREEKKES